LPEAPAGGVEGYAHLYSIVVAGVVRLLDPTPGMEDRVEERQ
jgi:hypothetical protein